MCESLQTVQLSLLTENGMGKAIQEYVDKDEKDAIEELITYQLEKTQRHLQARAVTTEKDIDTEVSGRGWHWKEDRWSWCWCVIECTFLHFQIQRLRDSKKDTTEEENEIKEAMSRAKAHRLERGDDSGDVDISDDLADVAMDSDEALLPPPTRGRGRGGRGRGSRGRGRGELSYYLTRIRSEIRGQI